MLEQQLASVSGAPPPPAPPPRVSARSIELKAAMKRRLTSPNTTALVERLTISGSPVWGLSQRERAMVDDVKRMMNDT